MTIEEERAARVLEDKNGATLGMDGGAMGGGRGEEEPQRRARAKWSGRDSQTTWDVLLMRRSSP